ncbi:chromophore lyase CpcT/CpeT [Kovacikia minuta CCNUW1]|uniref:chromophore lyase CpcT/CpeT n=1 Tax=Kovacikia minuta TaxID=2931930 RepID=UPI001CCCD856|nr:chromophore lyase CpcT/CpeT [Kovacikia minuta]UBF26441.1 chromophore lyase CpcT/CpeT [Kovacikia minuta CCNUW1]
MIQAVIYIFGKEVFAIAGVEVNDRRTVLLLMGIGWLTALSFPPVSTANPDLAQQVEEVATRLEGIMDTSAQAAANPKAANVRMTTCRVQVIDIPPTASGNAVFLYQEQALSQDLSKPYRQRFLQLSPSLYSQSVRSRSFKPTNPASWIGFCNKPIGDRRLQARDLGNPVCNVFLKRSGEGYTGNTPIDGCPANVRGAVRITNHVELHSTGMDTWDRGFDASGKQVWGAKAESYQFRRLR